MTERWLVWAVLEGLVRVLSNALQKSVKDLTVSFAAVLYLTLLIGMVQTVLGGLLALITREKILMHPKGILGSIAFGFLAVAGTVFTFLSFANGAVLSLHVFIVVTFSIIPGALCDRYIFRHPFTSVQWMGIAVAVIAGYLALELRHSIVEVGMFPRWMLFSFLATLGMVTNQVISQSIQSYTTAMAKNFWGGLTIVVVTGLLMLITGRTPLGLPDLERLMVVSVAIGILCVFLWTFNLWAYQGGAYIALKKLVVNASMLIIAALGGFLFFGERLRASQVFGFLLYGIAFVLADRETWEFARRRLALATS